LHFERDCELLYTQDHTHGEYLHAIDILKAAKLAREYAFSTQIECFTFSVRDIENRTSCRRFF